MKELPETLFMYIHHNGGVITSAIRLDRGYLYVGLAFCRPGDQFNKKIGKDIAIGRLDSGKNQFNFLLKKDVRIKKQVSENILKQIDYKANVFPSWVFK